MVEHNEITNRADAVLINCPTNRGQDFCIEQEGVEVD